MMFVLYEAIAIASAILVCKTLIGVMNVVTIDTHNGRTTNMKIRKTRLASLILLSIVLSQLWPVFLVFSISDSALQSVMQLIAMKDSFWVRRALPEGIPPINRPGTSIDIPDEYVFDFTGCKDVPKELLKKS